MENNTSIEEKNLIFTRAWLELYNTNVHQCIDELYAADFEVVLPGLLRTTDKSEFHSIEDVVLDAAPDRRAEMLRAVAKGNTVVIEAVSTWSDEHGGQKNSFWCAILTIENDKITVDHTYIDPTSFPGAAAAGVGRTV